MEAAASGSLRERLRLAVDGFGQLAGLVCQGALVQVRTSAQVNFGANQQMDIRDLWQQCCRTWDI